MVISIKNIIKNYGIEGDILLYRGENHRKKGLCDYLKNNLPVSGKTIITYSDGAFGLFLARALPDNQVITHYRHISPDYGELMEVQPNLTLVGEMDGLSGWKEYCKQNYIGDNYLFINQFEDSIVTDYYNGYFSTVVDALKSYPVDAFCDCGHSCQTLAGFISRNRVDNLVDWFFILGVNLYPRTNLWFLDKHLGYFVQYTTKDFDTLTIGKRIEAAFPAFGNVYEATRSITAAMSFLKDNPGKTVAVYVGDSREKEGTKFGQDK